MKDLGPKGGRQKRRQNARINVVVDQDSPINDAPDDWNPHNASKAERSPKSETALID
jgi:hypothetical protein